MSAELPSYFDPEDGTRYPLLQARWRSDEGRALMITPLPGISKADIDTTNRSIWRYRAALPIEIAQPVSLGEGLTPLLEVEYEGTPLHFKLEWFAPTGSFKDRGASVMISYLRQIGISAILEDSSGNGGAAVAAFGAAGGLKVRILCPDSTQAAKVAQMRALGAEVHLVPGAREKSEEEAIRQSNEIFYASHNWQPFFLQGTKLLAYELWEDLGFRVPDNIIIPAGAGSNILGCDIGFSELLAAGQIARRPRLFCAQPANCAPINASFIAGANGLVPVETKPTIAEGTAIKHPIRIRQILEALRRSGGMTVTASEDEIIAAVRSLAGRGMYVEPTTATAAAAAKKLVASGAINPADLTVVLLTGTGLKATARMTEIFQGASGEPQRV
ncbi:MAG: pyridoxal-5'-phosphate-dependent protein subunit beta [Hoeflea sp. BRH_c9]|nr:MAG: pyridoxal-5'-phosphate-dependent protein subunit beta [Hoeflea sp. BRH_c9]